MNNSWLLSFTFLKFWYIDAPRDMLVYFVSLNNYFIQLSALSLCIKTYFKPLKNEYREGLVGFSRAIGILVKTGLIIANIFIFLILILIEFVVIFSFLIFPIATVLILFL